MLVPGLLDKPGNFSFSSCIVFIHFLRPSEKATLFSLQYPVWTITYIGSDIHMGAKILSDLRWSHPRLQFKNSARLSVRWKHGFLFSFLPNILFVFPKLVYTCVTPLVSNIFNPCACRKGIGFHLCNHVSCFIPLFG